MLYEGFHYFQKLEIIELQIFFLKKMYLRTWLLNP